MPQKDAQAERRRVKTHTRVDAKILEVLKMYIHRPTSKTHLQCNYCLEHFRYTGDVDQLKGHLMANHWNKM